jgi:hypothetical protein
VRSKARRHQIDARGIDLVFQTESVDIRPLWSNFGKARCQPQPECRGRGVAAKPETLKAGRNPRPVLSFAIRYSLFAIRYPLAPCP